MMIQYYRTYEEEDQRIIRQSSPTYHSPTSVIGLYFFACFISKTIAWYPPRFIVDSSHRSQSLHVTLLSRSCRQVRTISPVLACRYMADWRIIFEDGTVNAKPRYPLRLACLSCLIMCGRGNGSPELVAQSIDARTLKDFPHLDRGVLIQCV